MGDVVRPRAIGVQRAYSTCLTCPIPGLELYDGDDELERRPRACLRRTTGPATSGRLGELEIQPSEPPEKEVIFLLDMLSTAQDFLVEVLLPILLIAVVCGVLGGAFGYMLSHESSPPIEAACHDSDLELP